MARPSDYRETHTIRTDVAYKEADKSDGGTQAGEGVLRPGRVVWTKAHSQERYSGPVKVYAEGIGLVELPAEALS